MIKDDSTEYEYSFRVDEFSDRCLSFTPDTASKYAGIVAGCTRIGRPVSVEDAQIAAIALTQGMSLATRNTSDFECIKGLTIINPWLSHRKP